MSLFHILIATRFSQCRDPRDKVFAVQGLARDWVPHQSILKPDSARALQQGTTIAVDYKLTVPDIFTRFAISDNTLHRDLRTLSCTLGPNPSFGGLPSWVPDWTNIYNIYPFVRFNDQTQFTASGRMKAVVWHSKNQKTFHVTGKHVDIVYALGREPSFSRAIGVFEIGEEKIEELQKSIEWLEDCKMVACSHDIMKKQPKDLWRTMVCELTGEGFPAPAKYAEYFDDYIGFLSGHNGTLAAPRCFQKYLDDARILPDKLQPANEVPPRGHALIEASISRWASRRRFCRTENGRLGFVPKAAREGDIICVLFGGEVPYVLRPWTDGHFVVVGECYVDGLMHGEGLSEDTLSREFKLL